MEKRTHTKRHFLFQIFLIIVVAAIAVLTFFAKQNPYFPFDLSITLAIQRFNLSWFDFFMRLLSFFGGNIVGTVIFFSITGFLYKKKCKKEAIFLIFSTVGIEAVSLIVKTAVGRVRPSPTLIHQFTAHLRNDSFPSGHVLYFCGFYGFLFFLTFILLQKRWYRKVFLGIFAIFITFIGMSRIYVGAHWFSDVVGGYLIGIVWLSFMIFLYNNWEIIRDKLPHSL